LASTRYPDEPGPPWRDRPIRPGASRGLHHQAEGADRDLRGRPATRAVDLVDETLAATLVKVLRPGVLPLRRRRGHDRLDPHVRRSALQPFDLLVCAPAGLEPATYALAIRWPHPLSYGGVCLDAGVHWLPPDCQPPFDGRTASCWMGAVTWESESQGGGGLAVAEHLAHDLRVEAQATQQRGRTVAQVVEANPPCNCWGEGPQQ
jgi:hypothetical protein